jgi:hypothetical protein
VVREEQGCQPKNSGNFLPTGTYPICEKRVAPWAFEIATHIFFGSIGMQVARLAGFALSFPPKLNAGEPAFVFEHW